MPENCGETGYVTHFADTPPPGGASPETGAPPGGRRSTGQHLSLVEAAAAAWSRLWICGWSWVSASLPVVSPGRSW